MLINAIKRPLTVLLPVVAGLLLFTSCGDDAEALSKEDFVEQADAICQATNDELEPIFNAVWEGLDGESGDLSQSEMEQLIFVRFDEAMDQVEPVMQRQIEDLRALAPPEQDREAVEAMLDDLETAVTDFAATTAAAVAGDETAMAALGDDAEDPFADVSRRAREYGLAACGEEG